MAIDREQVFKSIKSGRCAALLGGDAQLYDGMRTSKEMVEVLAGECHYPPGFPLSLYDVGEYFSELNGRNRLVERVVELVDGDVGASRILDALAAIPQITDIYVTPMDEHVQNFFPRGECLVIRGDKDVSMVGSRPRRIYRLNGTISSGEKLVLTKQQLIEELASGTRSPIATHLAYHLTTRQFLIIGHDLREWAFSFYLEQITHELGVFREKAVLFCEDPDPVLASHWSRTKNVEIIREDAADFLESYLAWVKT
jgi:hypothetical protein